MNPGNTLKKNYNWLCVQDLFWEMDATLLRICWYC
jgi:hypothetical protein